MLAHGRDEMLTLASDVVIEQLPDRNGWTVDIWRMSDADVTDAVSVYAAVLQGGAEDPVIALLEEAGIDLPTLLRDDERGGKDDITRSDLTELTAAATLIAVEEADVDRIVMPNVPKMSRRKSDSGIDVFEVYIDWFADDTDELAGDERLLIASVKHSVDQTASGLRWKLADSVSDRELSAPYLAAQLRVLHGRLVEEGISKGAAQRVYLFLRDFPDPNLVTLVAVGCISPELEADLQHHVTLLPADASDAKGFRIITFPNLAHAHERCP